MGEELNLDEVFYMVNGSTEEIKPLEIAEFKPGEIVDNNKFALLGEKVNEVEIEVPVILKTTTKKRFIKLLMGMGYQRNEANKMHDEFLKQYKVRTKLGMMIFEMRYKEMRECKRYCLILIGNREYRRTMEF